MAHIPCVTEELHEFIVSYFIESSGAQGSSSGKALTSGSAGQFDVIPDDDFAEFMDNIDVKWDSCGVETEVCFKYDDKEYKADTKVKATRAGYAEHIPSDVSVLRFSEDERFFSGPFEELEKLNVPFWYMVLHNRS